MIEVLEGNDLVSTINQTDRKISIKHYLNTYLIPIGENDKGEPIYPLYFRVIFNKQSVKIKSVAHTGFAESEFGIELFDERVKKLITREALILTKVINDFYFNVLRAVREDVSNDIDYSAREREVRQNIDINELFKNFNFSQFELPNIIEEILHIKVIEFAEKNKLYIDQAMLSLYSSKLSVYQLLQYLKQANPKWKEFEESYPSDLWFFNIHYYDFISKTSDYSRLGVTELDVLYLYFVETLQKSEHGDMLLSFYDELFELVVDWYNCR